MRRSAAIYCSWSNHCRALTVRQSAQRVGELLSEVFMEVYSSGKIYRCHRGDIFINPVQGEIRDFSIRLLSPDCVLATYRSVRADGSASLRSSVWQRIDGAWKMVFHQGTLEK